MRKTLIIFLTLFLAVSLLYAGMLFSEEETEPGSLSELTAEELCDRMKSMIWAEEEILDYIPELEVEFDESGEIVRIEYTIDGVARDIKDLDKEILMNIHSRIASERIRLMQERLLRQQQIQPPAVPVTPQTPQIPPKAPPEPPRLPPELSPPRPPSVPDRR